MSARRERADWGWLATVIITATLCTLPFRWQSLSLPLFGSSYTQTGATANNTAGHYFDVIMTYRANGIPKYWLFPPRPRPEIGYDYYQPVSEQHTSFARSQDGTLYYTSFPAAAFLSGHLATFFLPQPFVIPTINTINIILGMITAWLAGGVILRLARRDGVTPKHGLIAAIVTALLYALNAETLHSHTTNLWAYQWLMPLALLMIHLLLCQRLKPCHLGLIGIIGLIITFFSYTGLLINAGAGACLLWLTIRQRRQDTGRGVIILGIASLVSVMILGLSLISMQPNGDFIQNILNRLQLRSGLSIGFGYFLITLLSKIPSVLVSILAIIMLVIIDPKPGHRKNIFILFIPGFMALDFMLLNHALNYTFTGLWHGLCAILMVGTMLLSRPESLRTIIIIPMILLIFIINIGLYHRFYIAPPDIGGKSFFDFACSYQEIPTIEMLKAQKRPDQIMMIASIRGEYWLQDMRLNARSGQSPFQVLSLSDAKEVHNQKPEKMATLLIAGDTRPEIPVIDRLPLGPVSAVVTWQPALQEKPAIALYPYQVKKIENEIILHFYNTNIPALFVPGQILADVGGNQQTITTTDPITGQITLTGTKAQSAYLTGILEEKGRNWHRPLLNLTSPPLPGLCGTP